MKSAAKAFSAGDATGDKAGSVGGKFRSDGEIGKEGEKGESYRPFPLLSVECFQTESFRLTGILLCVTVGGTFSSKADGAVGSQFEKDGAVGGVSPLTLCLSFLNPLTDHSATSCDRPLPTRRPPRRPATRSGTPARPSRARSKHALLETSTFSIYGGELDCIPLQ